MSSDVLVYTDPNAPTAVHIGIDPSYSAFGLVANLTGPQGNDHREYLFDFSPKKAGRDGARLWHIYRTLRGTLTALQVHGPIACVAVEGYAPGRTQNREVLGELGAVVRMVLAELVGDPLVYTVAPTALKKFVTGSGTAPKDTIMLNVYKKWGVELHSNDVADAFGLMQIARAIRYGAVFKYEQEVVKQILAKRDNG